MSADCPQSITRRILTPAEFGHLLAFDLQDRSYTAVHSIVCRQCPILPSMRAELDRLALHAACGGRLRVIPAPVVSRWERTTSVADVLGPVGDVIVVGPHVYLLSRGDDGVVSEVERIFDADLADRWRVVISALYDRAEDPGGFCQRAFPSFCSESPASAVMVPGPRTSQGGGVPVNRVQHRVGVLAVPGLPA
jgi:hypothetical protein